MTAEVIEFPSGGWADDTIRRTISALVKGKGLSPDDVAHAAGLSRSAYFSKMKAHGRDRAFKAGEVADIAGFLGVKVQDLYDGLGGTFVPPEAADVRHQGLEPRTRCLRAVPDLEMARAA